MRKRHSIFLFFVFVGGLFLLLREHSASMRVGFDNYEGWQSISLIYFLMALLLVPVNWFLESVKWRIALSDYKPISTVHSLYSILLGVSAGILTPARVGEYVGRMSLMEKKDIGPNSLATFVSSTMQMIVTFLFGSVASIYIYSHYEFIDISQTIIISGGLVMLAFLIGLLFFLPHVINLLGRIRQLHRFLPDQEVTLPRYGIVVRVFLYSVLRYVVYALQYALVFLCFGTNVGLPILLAFILLAFLCQSLLPLPPMASLIGRGSVALLLFTQLGINEYVILSATFSIWVINLVLPAFCGMILFMNINKIKLAFSGS